MPLDPQSAPRPNLRLATESDRPALIELVNSAFSVETFLEGTRTDDERMAATMQKGAILVAEVAAGHLIACIHTQVNGTRGYMGQLAVHPAHQGSGLARILVQAAENQLRAAGCQTVDIVVLSMRPELIPIYRRFGFVETGALQDFRPSRTLAPGIECHGIQMSKQL